MTRKSAVALCVVLAAFASAARATEHEIYLVRHAEKTAEATDPGLTAAGRSRAEALAAWLSERDIQAAWSSDYRRTRDTLAPFIRGHDLPLQLYDPTDLDAFAATLRKDGRNAVVAGHSNTTPRLAALLCDCEVDPIAETEYDRLLLIRTARGGASLEVLDQRELFVETASD